MGDREGVAGSTARRAGTFGERASGAGWHALLVVALGLVLLCLSSGPPASAFAAARQPSRSCGGGQTSGPVVASTGNARLTLNTARGVVGSKIVARGVGWPAGVQVLVDIEQNRQLITEAQAVPQPVAANGTFEAPAIGAPAQGCVFQPAPGTVVQVVARSLDNHTAASAAFTYVAEPPVLAPSWTGTTIPATAVSVSATGLGWGAGTLVSLWAPIASPGASPPDPWLPPAGLPIAQVRADGVGAFTASVPLAVPAGGLRPGTSINLAASASTPLYGDVLVNMPAQFAVGLSVMPALSLDSSQGLAGAALTIAGDHWWPGDTVQIAYCRGITTYCNPYVMQQLGTAVVDDHGHFSARVALPTNARVGPISVEVYVGDQAVSPYLMTQAFEVEAPPLPWNKVHPRLAHYLPILAVTLLALAVVAAILWRPAVRRWRASVGHNG